MASFNDPLKLDQELAIALGWQELEVKSCAYRGSPILSGISPAEIPSKHTGYRAKIHIPKFSTEIDAAFQELNQLKHLGPVIAFNFEIDRWSCVFNFGLTGERYFSEGNTISEAITRSILLAVLDGQKPIRVNRFGHGY